MDIPLKDTPTHELIEKGIGGRNVDNIAVQDCMQLLRVAKVLLGFFYQRFSKFGISPGKYSVLLELLSKHGQGPLTPSDLAERIGVRRPTITGLVAGLESQGFVKRHAEHHDRRSVTVQLTPKGDAFVRDLLPGQFKSMAGVVGSLSPTQRRQLRTILALIEGDLK